MKSIKTEIRIGIFVLISIISLIGFLFIIDQLDVIKKKEVYVVEFDYIEKLEIGNYVKLKGNVKVGKVSAISFLGSKNKVLVTIYFQDKNIEKIFLTHDIEFKEASAGIIGASYIDMIVGKPYPEHMKLSAPKRYFFGKHDKNLTSSIQDAQKILDNIGIILKESNISSIITNVHHITEKVNQYLISDEIPIIIENLKATSFALKKTMLNVENISKNMDQNLNHAFIRESTVKINSILSNAEKSTKDFQYEFNNVANAIDKISKNVIEITNNINDIKYPIGAFIKSSSMKKSFTEIIESFNEVLKKLKMNPIINFTNNEHKSSKNPF